MAIRKLNIDDACLLLARIEKMGQPIPSAATISTATPIASSTAYAKMAEARKAVAAEAAEAAGGRAGDAADASPATPKGTLTPTKGKARGRPKKAVAQEMHELAAAAGKRKRCGDGGAQGDGSPDAVDDEEIPVASAPNSNKKVKGSPNMAVKQEDKEDQKVNIE